MQKKRLTSIISFLDKEDKIIDIGCDHAFVAISAAQLGSSKILATDIHKNAINSAQKNIEALGLSSKIELLCTDGLDGIDISSYDTLVIAGMGTPTIKHILSNHHLQKNIRKIILQSNNDLFSLRVFMQELGYTLQEEKVVLERGHYYVVMCYIYGSQTLSNIELQFGLYQPEKIAYYKYLQQYYQKILKKIPDNQVSEKEKIKKTLLDLQQYL